MYNLKFPERMMIYLDYYSNAETIYKIHPPFLHDFIDFVFDKARIYYDFNILFEASEFMKRNDEIIPSDPFSDLHRQSGFSIHELYRRTGHSLTSYECLYRISLFLKSKRVLELGTCIGMSSLSFALACKSGLVVTLEGNNILCAYSRKLFDQYQLKNIQGIHTEFNDYLNSHSSVEFDLVFLDGDHQFESTLNYISKILNQTSDTAVIILDDIHWSAGMYNAWKQIIQHPAISCSLETLRWGFLFKDKNLTKGNFSYIDQKFKPWKIGLF